MISVLPHRQALCHEGDKAITSGRTVTSCVSGTFVIRDLSGGFGIHEVRHFVIRLLRRGVGSMLMLGGTSYSFSGQGISRRVGRVIHRVPMFFADVCRSRAVLRLQRSVSGNRAIMFINSSNIKGDSLIGTLCKGAMLLASNMDLTAKGKERASAQQRVILVSRSKILVSAPKVQRFNLTVSGSSSLVRTLRVSSCTGVYHFESYERVGRPKYTILRTMGHNMLSRGVCRDCLGLQQRT